MEMNDWREESNERKEELKEWREWKEELKEVKELIKTSQHTNCNQISQKKVCSIEKCLSHTPSHFSEYSVQSASNTNDINEQSV